ncbi:hypothetical protein K7432_011685 [Basidiobolus ranarum]|uniref:Lysosomal dipeptide transporter MFSD1 n=1 Tax=Basidiobolus ranarum TaxID=34480 RepID=A0ABR2VTG6_9FUNG
MSTKARLSSEMDTHHVIASTENLTNARSSRFRWLILLFSSFLIFGSYYCGDTPGIISVQLRDHLGESAELWNYQLGVLYSIASLPNIFFPFFGGVLLDRLGRRINLITFASSVCIGQALFAIGVSVKAFWLMCIGRLLLGIGNGCLSVIQAKITAQWFRSSKLAFALAVNVTIGKVGSAIADAATAGLERHLGLDFTNWFGFILCLVSFACAMGLVYLDTDQRRLSEGILVLEANQSSEERLKLKEALALGSRFWLLLVYAVLLYGAITFGWTSSTFLQAKWFPNDAVKAGAVTSIINWISAFGTPVFGFLLDQTRQHVTSAFIGAVLICIAHLILGLSTLTPYVGYTILGIAYSFFTSAVWPLVPFVVDEVHLGTAFGFSSSAYFFSATIFPLINAKIIARSQDFTHLEIFFSVIAALGALDCLVLAWVKRNHERNLIVEKETRSDA